MDQTEAFRVLASADRQLLLHELVENEGEIAIAAAARQVAARRHRISPETISDDRVERAHIRLVHTHIPYLIDSDLVTVDWDEREMALAGGENIAELFEAADELAGWPPDDLLEPSFS